MMRGFSMLEALIALAIAATTLIAVTLVTLGTPHVLLNTRIHGEALVLASDGISREIARSGAGFDQTRSIASTTHDTFIQSILVGLSEDESMKTVVSTVTWRDRWDTQHSLVLEGVVSDYRNAAEYACSPYLFGNWEQPDIQEYVAPLPALTSMAATRTKIIAASALTDRTDEASLYMFDVSGDRQPPALIDSYDSASSTRTGYAAVAMVSDTVFALSGEASCASDPFCARLDIFSIAGDRFHKQYSMPLTPGRTILYRDGKLYIGLKKTATGPEFLVMDATHPAAVTPIATAEIGHAIYDIAARASSVYIATDDNASHGRAVMSFSMEHPHLGMQPTASTWLPGLGESRALALSGTLLYLGRTSPGTTKEFMVLETEGLATRFAGADLDTSVIGIIAKASRAFVLTKDHLAVTSLEAPFSSIDFSPAFFLPSGYTATDLSCSGRNLYIVASGPAGGRLISLSGS